jgi:phosphatidylethanolamine-binding protein (PEBP) family uncharacterized protein
MPKLAQYLVFLTALLLAACSGPAPQPEAPHVESGPTPVAKVPNSSFVLSSPEVTEGGALPKAFTCDGSSTTLPLEWSGEPDGTQSFAVIMHHIPGPGDSHWYWVVYNLPASVHSLAKNEAIARIGVLGNNSVNGQTAYAPRCSKGPGAKTYTYTVYALSAAPQLNVPPAQVTRNVLLAAMSNITLASAELNVTYSR